MLFWYELLYSGIGPGCQPAGFVQVDHDKGKWGIVAYSRELTATELSNYEMRRWAQ